jgi:hypothetical protein
VVRHLWNKGMIALLLLHLLLVMYYFPPHPQILTNLDGLIHTEIELIHPSIYV